MNVNISAWAIRKPVPSIVLFAVLLLLGIMSFRSLPVTRFPNIDVPVISVTITQSGAAPAELETQVTKQVEDALANVTGVKKLISTLTDGSSTTAIEFRLEIDQDRALNDVRDAIAKIRTDLPRNIDEPIIQRIDVEGQSIVSYAASAPGKTIEQLSWFVDDVVKRELQGLKGVGRVARQGGVVREIEVLLDPDRLLALGITASAVNAQVRATNVDLGGGRGQVGGQEQTIRTLAGAREVERLAETRIVLPGGRDVRLKDIARIVDGYNEPRSFADLDGRPVVTFAVFRAKGASEVTVADGVAKRIEAVRAADPDVAITKVDDSVAYTRGNYESAMLSLIEGAALAVLVVFLFLRDIRATLIAAIALPLSAIPTFWAMDAMGFSLNLVSLLAITLVTGVLVDDAIVEIENIHRHMKMGKSPYRAAIEAADEIGLAVIAITLTIVAIFAPVSFMGGIAGQYFKQFGLVVAAAVLFSLLVARLITPMMAAYLMRPVRHDEARDGLIMRAYVGLLRATLANRLTRFLTLATGVGIFVASIQATANLPTGFIPDEDASRIVVSTELPPGATLDEVRATTAGIARQLKEMPEVASVLTLGGTSPLGALELRRATLVIRLVPKSKRTLRQKDVEILIADRLATIPDARSWFVNERGERELSFSILSADGAALSGFVGTLEAELRRVPGFKNVASVGAVDRPEIRIVPRTDDAAAVGVSPETIADTVRVATLGDVSANLAKFNAGDRLVPIRVQLEPAARTDLQQIEQLRVVTQAGKAVPLKAVADVELGRGPSSIDRFSRVRRAVVGVDLAPGLALGDARERFLAVVERVGLPDGVRLEASGDAEVQDEVANGFLTAMGTGLMIVLGVLILLFGSVFQPITILLSLPLSFAGVVLALLVTANPVSMPVYIGLLMLMGIVTKNAILLVDFAVEEIARGTDRITALIEAGRKRARPIIMTTIAMVAGMVPAALALGDGGEFRAPMAIAVIGGLIVSTGLSLVFVPSFFTVMDDLGWVVGRVFAPLIGPTDEPDAVAAGHAGSGHAGSGHGAPDHGAPAAPLPATVDPVRPSAKVPIAAE
jgi:hydrophobe/amphiphile efflux-1 (HAE1) family protein